MQIFCILTIIENKTFFLSHVSLWSLKRFYKRLHYLPRPFGVLKLCKISQGTKSPKNYYLRWDFIMLPLFALFFLWSYWYFTESSCYFSKIQKNPIFPGFPYIFFALCTPCIYGYIFGQNLMKHYTLIKHYTLRILKDYNLVCVLSTLQQSTHLASMVTFFRSDAISCFIHWRFHIRSEEFGERNLNFSTCHYKLTSHYQRRWLWHPKSVLLDTSSEPYYLNLCMCHK